MCGCVGAGDVLGTVCVAQAERTIAGYAVGETLGKGGQAKVKLGTHLATGERVALKLFPSGARGRHGTAARVFVPPVALCCRRTCSLGSLLRV